MEDAAKCTTCRKTQTDSIAMEICKKYKRKAKLWCSVAIIELLLLLNCIAVLLRVI